MIDLDSLRGIVSRATGTGWQAAYRQDVEVLIAEVQRLRTIVADCEQNYRFAASKAEAKERAAVVAWLRDCDTHCREHDGRENAVSATYRIAANVIERGEHRREEEG